MAEIVITGDEIRSWLAEPKDPAVTAAFFEGQANYAKRMVLQLTEAIRCAREEQVEGWEHRVVAYELMIEGRQTDLSVLDR